MAHPRAQIRDAVIAKLKAANTAAGQKVFGNRARPVFPAELPCILVYTKNEPTDISIEAPREYKRSLALAVEIVAKVSTDEESLDDVLDDLCRQVEIAMFEDETFGGVASDTILGETEMDLLTEGEKPIGGAKITFTLPYYDQLPALAATGALVDLNKIDVKINMAPTDAQVDSEDLVPVPT